MVDLKGALDDLEGPDAEAGFGSEFHPCQFLYFPVPFDPLLIYLGVRFLVDPTVGYFLHWDSYFVHDFHSDFRPDIRLWYGMCSYSAEVMWES